MRPNDDNPIGLTPMAGVQGLMLAVLEDALLCYRKCDHEAPQNRMEGREAERWIRSDDWVWIFSFNNVCESLGLEPPALRRRILRSPDTLWSRRSHRVDPHRKRVGHHPRSSRDAVLATHA